MYHAIYIFNDGSPDVMTVGCDYATCVAFIETKVGRKLTDKEYDAGYVEHGDGGYWIIRGWAFI